ncbi:MAG: hypothetical protein K2L99_05905, partial [Muribaculaceae bacterium]|nr:hypothetical protein [Muribaculaceae bacterium]
SVRRLVALRLDIIRRLKDDAARAREELDEARAQMKALADEYVAMGQQCEEQNMAEAAMANYDKALRLCPDHTSAMLRKGCLFMEMGDIDGAEFTLRRAAEADESGHEALLALAQVYEATLAQAEALDCLLSAVERAPEVPEIHDRLAQLYDTLEMTTEAEEHRYMAARLRKKKKK